MTGINMNRRLGAALAAVLLMAGLAVGAPVALASGDALALLETKVEYNDDGSTTRTDVLGDGTITKYTSGGSLDYTLTETIYDNGNTKSVFAYKDKHTVTYEYDAEKDLYTVTTVQNGETTVTHPNSDGDGDDDEDGAGTSTGKSTATVSEEDVAAAGGGAVVVSVPTGLIELEPITINAPAGTTVSVPVTLAAGDNKGSVVYAIDADGTRSVVPKSWVDGLNATFVTGESGTKYLVEDNATAFPDVKRSDWFSQYGVVQGISAHELILGKNEGGQQVFAGNDTMTRAMVVTVLSRLEGATGDGSLAFDDVSQDGYYYPALVWAAGAGVVHGSDGKFMPNRNVTREQLVTMLMNYADSLDLDTSARANLNGYSDRGKLSYGENAMKWAVANGIVNGYDDKTLRPDRQATRAEASAIILNYIKWMLAA